MLTMLMWTEAMMFDLDTASPDLALMSCRLQKNVGDLDFADCDEWTLIWYLPKKKEIIKFKLNSYVILSNGLLPVAKMRIK